MICRLDIHDISSQFEEKNDIDTIAPLTFVTK